MVSRILFFTTTLLLAAHAPAHAGPIAVFPPDATNVNDNEASVVGRLLTYALATASQAATIGPERTAPALIETGDHAAAVRSLGTESYVRSSVLRMDKTILLQAWSYEGDRLVHQAQMRAGSLDDMPDVTERVAEALVNRTNIEDTRVPDNVTAIEAQPSNRTYTERLGGLYTMPVIALSATQSFDPGIALGLEVRLDRPDYYYEVGGGFLIPTGSTDDPGIGGLFANLGLGKYFSDGNTAPYIGAGVSPRIWGGAGDAIMGLAPYGQVGVVLGRDSSSRLFADLRVAQNLVPLERNGGYHQVDGDGEKLYPMEIGLRMGILF